MTPENSPKTDKAVSSVAEKLAPAGQSAPAKQAPSKAKAPKGASAKPASKPVKPVASAKPAKLPKPAKPAAPAKVEKPKKPKLVRDSFTFPKSEYEVIDALKTRSVRLKHAVKKSEVLRAGVKLLASLSDAALLAALKDIPALKTGRPKSEASGD